MVDHFDNNNAFRFVHAIQFLFNYAKAFLIWCTQLHKHKPSSQAKYEWEMRERRRDGNGLCRWKALTQSNRYAIIYCEKVVISYCVVITVSLAARNRASCICKIAGARLSASIFQHFCIFSPNFETSGIFSYLYYLLLHSLLLKNWKGKIEHICTCFFSYATATATAKTKCKEWSIRRM